MERNKGERAICFYTRAFSVRHFAINKLFRLAIFIYVLGSTLLSWFSFVSFSWLGNKEFWGCAGGGGPQYHGSAHLLMVVCSSNQPRERGSYQRKNTNVQKPLCFIPKSINKLIEKRFWNACLNRILLILGSKLAPSADVIARKSASWGGGPGRPGDVAFICCPSWLRLGPL